MLRIQAEKDGARSGTVEIDYLGPLDAKPEISRYRATLLPQASGEQSETCELLHDEDDGWLILASRALFDLGLR